MKTWYISFFISLLLLAIPGGGSAFAKESPAQSPEELDVYLCIGQSNMAGRGTLLPELTGTLEGVYLLNDRGEFEPAGNPLNKYSTIRKDLSMQALSPAYSFARKMAALSPRPVGLVVNARGGSSIDSWLKGSKDGYYEAALERVRLAQKQGGVLKAVIWHQGEADCQDPEAYRKKLALLVETLRADLGQPELPFVFGQLSEWNWTSREEGTAAFNAMLAGIPSTLAWTACVSSQGLDWLKDETDPHFGTAGQLILGERYADAVWGLFWQQAEERATELVSQMTLEEKIDYISGPKSFYIRAIPRLGIPEIHLADGPQGIRNNTRSTLYPAGILSAATWNRALVEQLGHGLGRDAKARGIDILLGPGVNIYRSPLCGRNYEYFGEDPYLSGETAKHYIIGVQKEGVMATVKHFAANNQESLRLQNDARISQRALREIYLRGFGIAIREGRPWTVMSSYNSWNGVPNSASKYLMDDLLRQEWGFKGYIYSDWGSIGMLDYFHHTAQNKAEAAMQALQAGMDAEASDNSFTELQHLVEEGFLDESIVSQFYSDNYARIILYTDTAEEGDEAFAVVEQVRAAADKYYSESWVCGQSANLYDMRDVVTADSTLVNWIAIGFIFLTLLVTFKSLTLPFVLLFVIETAIWINLAVPYFTDMPLVYIGYLVINTVQLGATIDYAILMTNGYLANRRTMNKRLAVQSTLSTNFESVLTSGLILSAAGFCLGFESSLEVVAELGILLARGTLLSMAMVVLALPALLMLFDPLTARLTYKAGFLKKPDKEVTTQ